MSTLFTSRTEHSARRLGNRFRGSSERTAGDARSALARILDGVNVGAIARPLASPQNGAPYLRTLIERNEIHETATAHWLAGRACHLHGHQESEVLLRILSGTVVEERYLPEGPGGFRYEIETLEAGQESYLPRGAFHRLHCLKDAATIHAFSPPPIDATAPVPSDIAPALESTKRRLLDPITLSTDAIVTAKRESIVSAVAQRTDDWARRENEQNAQNQTRVAGDTLRELRESGILAAPVPEQLGGWGSSLAETAQAVRNLARQAPATALALAMPLGNAATARIPDAVVAEPLRAELAAGRRWIAEQTLAGWILAVANSEPGAGGELAHTQTVAALQPDGAYRLSGKKSFATIGPDADYFLCAARRIGEGAGGKDVIDGFFVARDASGLVIDDAWDPLGMRPTASVGLTLSNVLAAAVLGYPGCLEGVNARHWSTVLFAAVFVGVGEGALSVAISGVGKSGANSSYVRASLAKCALELEAAAGLLETVANDERIPLPATARDRTIRAKTFAALTAVETATQAAMLSGGRAYRAEHPVARFLHDALAGPLLRPPLATAMDKLAQDLFASK
jgi:alkylation response protein AidB-like acyl-CoA dehydrogenase